MSFFRSNFLQILGHFFHLKLHLKRQHFEVAFCQKMTAEICAKLATKNEKYYKRLCFKIHNIEDKILKILKKSEQKIEYICLFSRTLHKIDKI